MSKCHRRQGEARRRAEGHRRWFRSAALWRAGLVLTVLVCLAAGPGLLVSQAAAAAASPAPASHAAAIHFVFLGDIWKYDFATAKATVEVDCQGKRLSEVSWSRNGEALAWIEETGTGTAYSERLMFYETVSDPSGAVKKHAISGAFAPALSPDGRMCIYETGDSAANPRVHVYDIVEGLDYEIPGEAANGTWVDADQRIIAFNRPSNSHFTYGPPNPALADCANSGYVVRNLATGIELPVPAAYPDQSSDESNVWWPQGDFGTGMVALTKWVPGSGEAHVVVVSGMVATKVADVSGYQSHAYRWAFVDAAAPAADSNPALFVEVDPHLSAAAGAVSGRPDIYRVAWSGSAPSLVPAFRACSFNGSFAALPPESPFKDMTPTDKYYKSVAYMTGSGIISGTGNGTFNPRGAIKRAQFAKMIDGALFLSVTEDLKPAFNDLGEDSPTDLYPHQYVAAAAQGQLVTGYPDGGFHPYDAVTRAQVLTMVVRAGDRYVAGGLAVPPSGWRGALSGYSNSTHGANVHRAEYNGLLKGIDLNGWDPAATANRGEVAQTLYNLMAAVGPTAAR